MKKLFLFMLLVTTFCLRGMECCQYGKRGTREEMRSLLSVSSQSSVTSARGRRLPRHHSWNRHLHMMVTRSPHSSVQQRSHDSEKGSVVSIADVKQPCKRRIKRRLKDIERNVREAREDLTDDDKGRVRSCRRCVSRNKWRIGCCCCLTAGVAAFGYWGVTPLLALFQSIGSACEKLKEGEDAIEAGEQKLTTASNEMKAVCQPVSGYLQQAEGYADVTKAFCKMYYEKAVAVCSQAGDTCMQADGDCIELAREVHMLREECKIIPT